jgi:hypothetical protein
VQSLIDLGGDCIEICGEVITSSGPVDSADSAIEALCVNSKSSARAKLARQLMATALNCIASGGNVDCESIAEVEPLFRACNEDCPTGDGFVDVDGDPTTPEVDCTAALECFNRGGTYDPQVGTCVTLPGNCSLRELGTCSDAASTFCTAENVGKDCGPSASCETGAAGSQMECSDAVKTVCAVLGDGERACSSGNECQQSPEQCCEPNSCPSECQSR